MTQLPMLPGADHRDEARASGRVSGLTVGVRGPHGMPEAVRDAADLHLASPHDAARLLAVIARIVGRTG